MTHFPGPCTLINTAFHLLLYHPVTQYYDALLQLLTVSLCFCSPQQLDIKTNPCNPPLPSLFQTISIKQPRPSHAAGGFSSL